MFVDLYVTSCSFLYLTSSLFSSHFHSSMYTLLRTLTSTMKIKKKNNHQQQKKTKCISEWTWLKKHIHERSGPTNQMKIVSKVFAFALYIIKCIHLRLENVNLLHTNYTNQSCIYRSFFYVRLFIYQIYRDNRLVCFFFIFTIFSKYDYERPHMLMHFHSTTITK